MRILKSLPVAVFTLFTLMLFVPAQSAIAQGPAYLHAISDLRSARWYLQQDHRGNQADALQHAIEEINKALDEMKIAAARDGKDVWQTPPPQSGGDAMAPIHSAVRLLREARGDVGNGTDFPQNQGLQARSVRHIDEALRHLQPFL
jgi:hypothetical protein